MSLTDAEYRLLNANDFEICLENLSGPEKRTVARLRKRGMLKNGSDAGLVAITNKGQRAWWARHIETVEYQSSLRKQAKNAKQQSGRHSTSQKTPRKVSKTMQRHSAA